MSWFDFTSFRRKQYQEPPPPDTPSEEVPPPVSEEGKKWMGFDPTGLERAAKAARELDKSRKLDHAARFARTSTEPSLNTLGSTCEISSRSGTVAGAYRASKAPGSD